MGSSADLHAASVNELLAAGMQHHQCGNLALAATAYRQVLQLDPNHGEALYLLGRVAGQCGEDGTAIEHFHRAIATSTRWRAVWHRAYLNPEPQTLTTANS